VIEVEPRELRERLTAALGVERWVRAMEAEAPFASVDALVTTGRRLATPLSRSELDEAVSHHPRIGERPAGSGTSAALSRSEQGGLGSADADVDAAIAAGNAAYEERFGRVFLIRAAGRTRPEILAELTRRLQADAESEADEATEQLRQIMELRLTTLFADEER
jgi:2-oxo-4-hydroxy-4-carboxy-5-ureidoimidazoline decarboxylase